jgi:hypothetical protein
MGKARKELGVERDEHIGSPEVGHLQALLYGNSKLMPELPLVEVCMQHNDSSDPCIQSEIRCSKCMGRYREPSCRGNKNG